MIREAGVQLFDEEAEQVVLGSLMQSPALFNDVAQLLRPEDFYYESHRLIYQTIAAEIDRGQEPNPMLIINALKSQNLLERVGNRSAILHMASQGVLVGVPSLAQKIRELSLRRNLLSSFRELEKKTCDTAYSLESVLNDTEAALTHLADRYSNYNVVHIRDVNEDFMKFIQHVRQSHDGITGTASGFRRLDDLTGGFKPGQMIVIAARPGVGKTTLALNIALNVCMNKHKPMAVVYFSLEMTRLELLLRLVSARAFLDSQKVQKGRISEKEMGRLVAAAKELYDSEFYIDDSAELTSWEFKQRARRLWRTLQQQGKELGLIVVDYLQLMTDRERAQEGRQNEVAAISRAIKLIAKDLRVPILALSQMNRAIEQRGRDPRPQLSDLRESGAIEQDADMVIFIHREYVVGKDSPENESKKNVAEIIIGKNRSGPRDSFELAFLSEKSLFTDYEPPRSE
ncbi:MAG: replicative DNA helicase [Leptospiraceae bacterium]|nr:replicative DNA helicase [Leptospiraceae bacterium]